METSRLAGIQADLKFGLQTEKQLAMNWDSKPRSCDHVRQAGTQRVAPVVFAGILRGDAATADFVFLSYKETYPAGATTCQKAVWGGTAAIRPRRELWVKVFCLQKQTQLPPEVPNLSDKQESLNQLRII